MARTKKNKMAMLILNEAVVLPNMILQIDLPNNPKVTDAIDMTMRGNQCVFITGNDGDDENVSVKSLSGIGTVANVYSLVRGLPGDKIRVNFKGNRRARLLNVENAGTYYVAEVEFLDEELKDLKDDPQIVAMTQLLKEMFVKIWKGKSNALSFARRHFDEADISELIDDVAGALPLTIEDRRIILTTEDVKARFVALSTILTREIEVDNIKSNIHKRLKEKVDKNQREYVLRTQLREIQKELGEDGADTDYERYNKELSDLVASDDVKARIKKEIDRLKGVPNDSSEGAMQRGFVETLLEMPWDKVSKDNKNIAKAEKILNRDHYGLLEVKERVLEFLSVRILNEKGNSPIICLVGPPGTGKTSIARSVAEALNKKYIRISLGGVRDEAEIRGHRRTYVGAMPGRIATGLKSAGVKNPLMVLDEIDKTSTERNDTSAALLEVLDGEQNSKFRDHYIDIPVDLSEVLFIATANDKGMIPRPLLDRMEIIDVSGYTENEKFHIAKEHLIKKQYKENGIKASALKISDDAIISIIQHYTKESGVRGLERCIGRICRKAAKTIVKDGKKSVRVTKNNLYDFLGIEKYHYDMANEKNEIGIVRGLAWTAVGGDTLQIEVNTMPGKGEIILTGQLGDVMKESANIGISYIRSIAGKHKIPQDFFKKNDFHIHIPQGSVPKDGPSAGITMATAVFSAVTKKPVRADIAMTGEITLRGRVLPIGGLKEKLLAAKDAGIKTVLVPVKNEPDVSEIDDEIKDGLNIVFVETMDEVLRRALV